MVEESIQCPLVENNDRELLVNELIRPEDVKALVPHVERKKYYQSHLEKYVLAMDFIKTNIEINENINFQHWKYPTETWNDGEGDFKDIAFLIASILIALDYDWQRIRVAIDEEGERAWTEIVGGNGVIIIDPEEGTCTPYLLKMKPQRYQMVKYYIYQMGCRRKVE